MNLLEAIVTQSKIEVIRDHMLPMLTPDQVAVSQSTDIIGEIHEAAAALEKAQDPELKEELTAYALRLQNSINFLIGANHFTLMHKWYTPKTTEFSNSIHMLMDHHLAVIKVYAEQENQLQNIRLTARNAAKALHKHISVTTIKEFNLVVIVTHDQSD